MTGCNSHSGKDIVLKRKVLFKKGRQPKKKKKEDKAANMGKCIPTSISHLLK